MNEWKPKEKHPVKIRPKDPQNVLCVKCQYWGWRGWADKIKGQWICHDCQDEEAKE